MIDAPPWWARIPCNCWSRPASAPEWFAKFWFCTDCGQRWRLMPNGSAYSWVKA